MPDPEVVLADTPAALAEGVALLDDLDVLAVDVERADSDRYFRRAALVQVGGEGRVALVDPLALDDLDPLQALLEDRTVVLHALDNDIGPLADLGLVPTRIEDTSVAAAMLGLPLGLETLLTDLLGVSFDADKARMQRADWERRALTDEMLAYAAADVADLPALWAVLEGRLRETGRWSWYREELRAALQQPPVEERRDWRRTKGIGRLQPLPRARLHALWARREELARSTDTAPNRIANDRVLIDLAATPPARAGELPRRGMHASPARRFGSELLRALESVAAPEPDSGREDRFPTPEERERADRLRARRTARAKELGLDPGVLCPSRAISGAATKDPTTP